MAVGSQVFRSLASLHRAGVPWPQALASAAGTDMQLRGVQQALSDGAGLADAMAPVVEPLDLALLRAGEQTGGLEEALDRIAARHDADRVEEGKRRTALAYPVVMAHVAAVLLALPDLIAGRGLAGLVWSAAALAPVYLILWLTRRRAVRPGSHSHPGTRQPRANLVMRNAIEEADSRALTALADCYEGGVPINETLELVAAAGGGGRVAWDVYRAMPRVKDGIPLSACWHAIAPEHAEELRTAEEAGELGKTARHLAERLRFGVAMRRQKLASLLPLVVLLVIGGVIAVRVIGFYSDLYGNLPM